MSRVDLRRLRYFVTVAEERHFGRAAARLHMSAPPLSQRIAELETDLGVVLFERTSRRVDLTPAGERLLPAARSVLRAAEEFEELAGEVRSGPSELAFGFCHGSEGGAMSALRRYRDELPQVVVRPSAMTSLSIVEAIRSGRLAAGIVRGPIGDPSTVSTVPLVRVPVDHVVLPVNHRLAEAELVRVDDLAGEPVLVVDRADAPLAHDQITAYFASVGIRPQFVHHGATQIERVLDMVAIGTGIGWANAWQAERLAGRGDVAVRPLDPVGMWDEFAVVWRTGDTRPTTGACVRVVLETCST